MRDWSFCICWVTLERPAGGIITFTPQAIVDDPLGVSELIKQISKHPLWDAFVLPGVLGMVSKIVCGQEDPLKVFDKWVLRLCMLHSPHLEFLL